MSKAAWKQAKKMMKGQQRFKGDERILGDSDFVLDVLGRCNEKLERRYQLSGKWGRGKWGRISDYKLTISKILLARLPM